jgi:hypothetical protein
MVYILLDEPLTPHNGDIMETQRWCHLDIVLWFLDGGGACLCGLFCWLSGSFAVSHLQRFCGRRPTRLFGGGGGWPVTACGTTRCGFPADAVGFALHKPCLAKTEPSG